MVNGTSSHIATTLTLGMALAKFSVSTWYPDTKHDKRKHMCISKLLLAPFIFTQTSPPSLLTMWPDSSTVLATVFNQNAYSHLCTVSLPFSYSPCDPVCPLTLQPSSPIVLTLWPIFPLTFWPRLSTHLAAQVAQCTRLLANFVPSTCGPNCSMYSPCGPVRPMYSPCGPVCPLTLRPSSSNVLTLRPSSSALCLISSPSSSATFFLFRLGLFSCRSARSWKCSCFFTFASKCRNSPWRRNIRD